MPRATVPTSAAVDPIYVMPEANAPLDLGTHEISFQSSGRETVARLTMYLRCLPTLRLYGELARENPLVWLDPNKNVALRSLFTQFLPLQSGLVSGIGPRREPVEIKHVERPRLQRVIFHLMNFHNFVDSRNYAKISDGSVSTQSAVIHLREGGWNIMLHAVVHVDRAMTVLDREGGYAITHVGSITRRRNGLFAPHQAKRVLEILRLFFSFARGTFTGCVLPVGFDENGQKTWGQWGAQHSMSPWGYFPGWFTGRSATILEESFPGFFRLWQDPVWREPLRQCLYLYLRANNHTGVGVDGGLILAQATLEKLAWVHCVEKLRLYSRRQFKNPRQMPAKEKIRLLLRSVGLSLDIPPNLECLSALARSNGWPDGPEALVELRNEIVHAEQKVKDAPFYDGWMLGQYYVELVLLRLADHHGYYINRITARNTSDVTKVPWA